MLENLKDLERGIKEAQGKDEKDMFIELLKDDIKEADGNVDAETQKLIDKLKETYLGAKKKATPKAEKKPSPKTTKKPKAKSTPEEKAERKRKINEATGKTIEECKEILAKYEALRGKTTQKDKQRVEKLKDEDKIIDGTNVKTADATTETTTKQIPKKIKQEVDAIEKEAEKEAKGEVTDEMVEIINSINKKGKSKTEVKKEIDKVTKEKIEEKTKEKIEEKVEDMTSDLADAGKKFIKSIQTEIAKYSKDDAKKFLIDLKGQIDALLKAYGYGGAVQSYDIAWAGGGRPMPMFEKGGKFADGGEIKLSEKGSKLASLFEKSNELRKEYLRGYSKGDLMKFAYGSSMRNVDTALPLGALESYGIDADQRYRYVMDYNDKSFGEIVDLYDKIAERNPKVEIYNTDYEIVDTLPINEAYSKYYKNNDFPYMLDAFGEDKYSKGGKFADGGMENIYRQTYTYLEYVIVGDYPETLYTVTIGINEDENFGGEFIDRYGEITINEIKEIFGNEIAQRVANGYGRDYEDGDYRSKVIFVNDGLYKKGGKLPRKKGLGWKRDRERLSKEPHEQAYKSKRKGDYSSFSKGGEILNAIAEDWGRNSDVYYAVQNSYVFFDSDEKAKKVLENYDVLEDYEHIFNEDKFAKGGRTTRGYHQDRARLSQESWEQAYLPKRKGNYTSFEKGGELREFDTENEIEVFVMNEYGLTPFEAEVFANDYASKYVFPATEKEVAELYQKLNKPYAKGGKTWVQDVVDSPNFREGAFKRKAEARGMSTDAFMNQVLHSPHLYDERTRKQAQFMKNAFND